MEIKKKKKKKFKRNSKVFRKGSRDYRSLKQEVFQGGKNSR